MSQSKPLDEEISEVWIREVPDLRERSVHGVEVTRGREPSKWPWRVGVWVMEHVRDVPLEIELRREIAAALRAVPGVVEALEEDREVWAVRGEPEGKALAAAVGEVLDALDGELRAYLASR